ncbi:MAG: tandem-95 repeat protein [Alphaproteobacteria bacterium]|nr:tandem-95 repeat protein [Alphaproteobacteria bacterium]
MPNSTIDYNSNNFNLTDWDLTLPVNATGGTSGTGATVTSLTDYASPYFYGNPDGSMTFAAPVSGATTAATFGTGSGLNEQGTAGWTLSTGGTMSATLAVNSVPTLTSGAEGSVIVGQLMVQNSNEALIQIYYDAGKIYFKNTLYNGHQDTYQFHDAAGKTPVIGLNQTFSYVIEAQGSTLTAKIIVGGDTYTSVTSIDSSWGHLPLYFKAGVFDGESATSGTSLPQATGAGQTTFYGLDMSHIAGDGLGGVQAPVAGSDSFTGAENQAVTGNVLANDTGPGGLALSVAPQTLMTAHGGTVVENSSGSFTYTPAANFTGTDSFNYTLTDGSGLTSMGAVDVVVKAPQTTTLLPPVAVTETFTGAENQPLTGNVLTNDSDPNGLTLSLAPETLTTAHGGTVVENANGSFTYTPAAGYVGADSFTYTVQDSGGATATGTENVGITPSAGYSLVFDPSFATLSLESSLNKGGTWDTTYPYATPGSAAFSGRTLPSNNEAEFYSDPTVGVNPFSVGNGVLTITAAPATAQMLATEAAANNGATLPYTSGLLTTYTSFAQTYGLYEVTAKLPAGQGLWPALWLLPANMSWPPEIDLLEEIGNQPTTDYMTLHSKTNGTIGITYQVPMTTGFHTYAVDWEPNTITFYVDGKQVGQEATPADMHQAMYFLMNLAVGGAGSWPGAPNSATAFPAQMEISSVQVYASPNTIADYNTVGVQATTGTVTAPPPPSAPPAANPDSFTGTENHAVTGNVLTNDTDPNGLALSVTAGTFATAHGGSVVMNANGTFTYTPAANFTGTDSFTYTLNDSAGLTATGTATLGIAAASLSPPVAAPDSFTGAENHVITGNVLTNDTDQNGLALSVAPGTFATAHGGILLISADGSFTYTPAAGFAGTDSVYYTLSDSAGLKSSGLVTLTVDAPPVAAPDSFTGTENHAITGDVLMNDTDPNGLALHVTAGIFASAHGGTVVENADGTFTYTPAANFIGTDSFTYTLNDSAGLTATGTATVAVNPPPVNPIAQTDIWTGMENLPMFGNVLANNGNGPDSDPGGLSLSVKPETLTTAHGATVTEASDGTFTYAPKAGFTGTDSFTYTGQDSAGHTSTGTVNVTIEPPATTGETITFGYGSNMLYGASGGHDTFVFKAANLGSGADTIRGFSAANGDKIDISDVLSGHYNPAASAAVSNFVNVVTSGHNSIVEVDLSGHAGAAGWTQVVAIFSEPNLNEQTLISHGNLVV